MIHENLKKTLSCTIRYKKNDFDVWGLHQLFKGYVS